MDIFYFQRCGQTQDHGALEQLTGRLVLRAVEDDKISIQSATQECQQLRCQSGTERTGRRTYRISKSVNAFLPVTVVNGLKEGISRC